jgi:hypothetical protein
VETYEQALAWLGADASQADDTIVALYGVKVSHKFRSVLPSSLDFTKQSLKDFTAHHLHLSDFPTWLFVTSNNYPQASQSHSLSSSLAPITHCPTLHFCDNR